MRKADKIVEDRIIKTIIDKLPDEYDKKRRKVAVKEKDVNDIIEKADEKISRRKVAVKDAKVLKEIKDLEAKQGANDEYRKLKAEVKKGKKLKQIEKSSSSSGSNVFGIRGTDAQPLPNVNLEAPSKMNLQKLTEILQHKANNDKLSKEGKSAFQKAKDNLLKNKGDAKIKTQTILEYRRIYKDEVYKK